LFSPYIHYTVVLDGNLLLAAGPSSRAFEHSDSQLPTFFLG
jgi:hypothetical protein